MPTGVYSRKKKHKVGYKGNRYSDATKTKARKALERGTGTVKEIAQELGVSPFTLKEWKKEWGMVRHRGSKKQHAAEVKKTHEFLFGKSEKKKPADKKDAWEVLRSLIKDYAEAAIADSWKGGGDPADYELIETRLKLAEIELQRHVEEMRRGYEE